MWVGNLGLAWLGWPVVPASLRASPWLAGLGAGPILRWSYLCAWWLVLAVGWPYLSTDSSLSRRLACSLFLVCKQCSKIAGAKLQGLMGPRLHSHTVPLCLIQLVRAIPRPAQIQGKWIPTCWEEWWDHMAKGHWTGMGRILMAIFASSLPQQPYLAQGGCIHSLSRSLNFWFLLVMGELNVQWSFPWLL